VLRQRSAAALRSNVISFRFLAPNFYGFLIVQQVLQRAGSVERSISTQEQNVESCSVAAKKFEK